MFGSVPKGTSVDRQTFDLAGRAGFCVLSALVTAPLGINPNDPQAIQELPWRSDSVRRTFAPRYLHAFGLRAVALRRAGRVVETDGMVVLEGGAFAFDIAEDAGSDLDETVELALVVDPAVGRLLVGWDANVAAENAISVEVPAEDEPWVTVAIPLERARFAGRGPRGTDVVVAAPGCEYAEGAAGPDVMRIRDVSVRRHARAEAAENRTARIELTLLDEHGAPTAAGWHLRCRIWPRGPGGRRRGAHRSLPRSGPGRRGPDLGKSTSPARCSPRCSTATTTSAGQADLHGRADGA